MVDTKQYLLVLESCLCLGFDRDEYVFPMFSPPPLVFLEHRLTRITSTILMDAGISLASAE